MKHRLLHTLMLTVWFSCCHAQISIQMERKAGVYFVPCKLNGLELKFIFDTGASDVSISLSEALFMLKNGYLNDNDFIGTEQYEIANGDIQEGSIVNIRSLEIGNVILKNVPASIVHTMSAPLLLGQSAISRFGAFSIDYNTDVLTLGRTESSTESVQHKTFLANQNSVEAGQVAVNQTLLSEEDSRLLKEAYLRMLWEISASHILVSLREDAAPADTILAWQRITNLRNRVLAGEDWGSVARGPGGSEDTTVSKNNGYLGWFSVLQMVYPFETAAYKTPVGDISAPVRTRFGYHIIKVLDKRPARGNIRVAHIMMRTDPGRYSDNASGAERRIQEVYALLSSGQLTFKDAALLYSEDESTSSNGGELPLFGTGVMIDEFADAAFSLYHIGDISPPIRTRFGWHIIKLIERPQLPSFGKAKSELWQRVIADGRYHAR